MFDDIKKFTYIRLVKCDVKILNGSKANAPCFGFVVVKMSKTNIIIPLWPSYYKPQNPKNTISQNSLKHYNQYISVRTEAIRWLQIATYKGNKL